jgi:hypothetical protein
LQAPPGPRSTTVTGADAMMTIILDLAFLAGGFFSGWLARTIVVMAQISYSQERMQRRVRYWQREAARAHVIAEQLAARAALPIEDQDWAPPGYS